MSQCNELITSLARLSPTLSLDLCAGISWSYSEVPGVRTVKSIHACRSRFAFVPYNRCHLSESSLSHAHPLAPPTYVPMAIVWSPVNKGDYQENVLPKERSCLTGGGPGPDVAYLHEFCRISPLQPQDLGQHSQAGPWHYSTAGVCIDSDSLLFAGSWKGVLRDNFYFSFSF